MGEFWWLFGLFNWEPEMSACWCLPCVYAPQLVCYTCLEMMLHFRNHFHKCSSQMHETKPWKAQKHCLYSQESRIVQTRPSMFSEEFFCYFGKGDLHKGSLPNPWKIFQFVVKLHAAIFQTTSLLRTCSPLKRHTWKSGRFPTYHHLNNGHINNTLLVGCYYI